MKRIIFLGTVILVMALATTALATNTPADTVERGRDRVTDCVPRDLVIDRVTDCRPHDRVTDRVTDRATDRATDRVTDHVTDRVHDRVTDRVTEYGWRVQALPI